MKFRLSPYILGHANPQWLVSEWIKVTCVLSQYERNKIKYESI